MGIQTPECGVEVLRGTEIKPSIRWEENVPSEHNPGGDYVCHHNIIKKIN